MPGIIWLSVIVVENDACSPSTIGKSWLSEMNERFF